MVALYGLERLLYRCFSMPNRWKELSMASEMISHCIPLEASLECPGHLLLHKDSHTFRLPLLHICLFPRKLEVAFDNLDRDPETVVLCPLSFICSTLFFRMCH